MSRNLVANQWATYAERVLPADAQAVQTRETRRAFYAGCESLLRVLLRILDPGSDATEADVALMQGVESELRAFAEDVRKGAA